MKIVHLPDIHLGHSKVSSERIHYNLRQFVYPELNNDLDILIIGGDFFDTLLDMNGRDGCRAATIIAEMKSLAYTYQFKIRVIRGTFTHDRHQNQFFLVDSGEIDSRVDKEIVKVYDTIALEHFNDLGIDIMYIADDLPFDNCFEKMQELLQENQIDKVDFIINHGYFDHMVPSNKMLAPNNLLFRKQIEPIVRGCVLNGHVHTPSIRGKVISGGSFERMKHGEEEAKGFFVINYEKEKHELKCDFIINENAILFKTIDLSDCKDFYEAIDLFDTWMDNLSIKEEEDPIYLRALLEDNALRPVLTERAHLKFKKPYVTIKSHSLINEETSDTEDVLTDVSDLPILTPDNIEPLVYELLIKKNISISEKEISEVFEEIVAGDNNNARKATTRRT